MSQLAHWLVLCSSHIKLLTVPGTPLEHVHTLSAQHSVCVHGKVTHVTESGLSMMCSVFAVQTAVGCAPPAWPTYVHPAVSSQLPRRASNVVPTIEHAAGGSPFGQLVPSVGNVPPGHGLQASVEAQVGGSQVSETPPWLLSVCTKPALHTARLSPAAVQVTDSEFATASQAVHAEPSPSWPSSPK